jgi:hypothetical protein
MAEWQLYLTMIWVLLALAVLSFVLLMFIPAPYGRHVRSGWGPVGSGTGRLDRDGDVGRARLRLGVFCGASAGSTRRRSRCSRCGKCITSIVRSSFRSERTAESR